MKNPPAFPRASYSAYTNLDAQEKGGYSCEPQDGMTLRDYFAAKALTALVAAEFVTGDHDQHAQIAYAYADAMLKAREEQ